MVRQEQRDLVDRRAECDRTQALLHRQSELMSDINAVRRELAERTEELAVAHRKVDDLTTGLGTEGHERGRVERESAAPRVADLRYQI